VRMAIGATQLAISDGNVSESARDNTVPCFVPGLQVDLLCANDVRGAVDLFRIV